MFSKLDEVESRYEQVNLTLQRPDIANNQAEYRSLMKELSELEKIVTVYRQWKKCVSEIQSSRDILEGEKDEELRAMARAEISDLEPQLLQLQENLKLALLPKDPNDDKNIILEIRPGAGGDESSLFTEELFRAYTHFASTQGWKVKILSMSQGNVGGFKEVIASVTGEKVFSKLKYESGVHRVQRVPETETQGRVHTSTVTVAVLPEAEEVDVKINPNEIRIDVMRASGAGGQSVNTTDSAVRLTHIPTGIIVYCQEQKSQLGNKEQAFKILYSRLLALEQEKARKEASDTRLSQIGTGDRSERIRTYNFPQSRITDHRIGLTIHQINQVMQGQVDLLIDPLVAHYQAEALKNQK